MTNEEKMMLAIETAKLSLANGELPIGAVIFKGDELIGKAYSSGENDSIFLRHAEMKVLWEADKKKYTVPERKSMQLFVTLEPCMMCLGAALGFFIGEVYYALESPIDGAVSFAEKAWKPENNELPSYQLPKCYGGLLKAESQELLRQYIELKKEGALVDFCKTLIKL